MGPMLRPMLRPGLRLAWRAPDTLQLGIDVSDPVIVSGVPPVGHALVAAMDGIRTRAQLVEAMVRGGLDDDGGETTEALIDRMAELGLVIDGGAWPRGADCTPETLLPALPSRSSDPLGWSDWGPPMARRSALANAEVVICGAGRLGGLLARALTGAGVGRVQVDDARPVLPEDVAPGGFSAGQVGQARCTLSSGAPQPPAERAGRLVVVTDEADVDAQCTTLTREGTTHLVVTCREQVGRIGPLVEPGATPCHFCLELARRDRDPAYPQVWRQSRVTPLPECAPRLGAITAHVAAAQVVEWAVGGRPPTTSQVFEVVAPYGLVERRPSRPHPECGCAWPGTAA